MRRDTSLEKIMAILAIFLLLLYQMSAGYCQIPLVDESEMIKTKMGNSQLISNGRSA
jgi:hypothetical protein